MKEFIKTAELYYNTSSGELQALARKFFKQMDSDGDGKVSLHEFLGFLKSEGYAKLGNRHIFKQLDRDGDGSLDFMEVIALYYIIKSGRPFCEGCDKLVCGMYFTCSKCFRAAAAAAYSVCPACFKGHKFIHKHPKQDFLDNFALLESKRKSDLATRAQRNLVTATSSSAAVRRQPASTSTAIVPYRPHNMWTRAFRVFEAAVYMATSCTVM